jgi:hypothetical protein
MAVQTQIQTRRGTAATWTSTNPTLAAGEFGYESDTGKFKIGNGSTAWASLAYTAAATAVTYLFNATSGQTTFSGADANGLTLAYTVGSEQVYLNGVLQVRGSDYTGTNGTSIVLTSGALTSDVLNVIAYSAMTVTDTYTQAQADAKFFQTANAFLAGKNKIINGDFSINQRDFTTSTAVGSGFIADRMAYDSDGSGTVTKTYSAFTAGSAPVAGYEAKNYGTIQTTGQSAASVYTYLVQNIEDVRTFANQTVTFSFWAKAASGTPKISLENRQNFGSGGSAAVNTNLGVVTLSTSWTRYSVTATVPSVSGKTIGAGSYSRFTMWVSAGTDYSARTNSIGIQSNTFDIWGVQVEAGSIATPFQTATGTIAGELAACQRYYYRFNAVSGSVYGFGFADSTTSAYLTLTFPVTMRVAPTSLDQSGTVGDYTIRQTGGSSITVASVLTIGAVNTNIGLMTTTVASGLTGGQAISGRFNGTAGYVGWSAEL